VNRALSPELTFTVPDGLMLPFDPEVAAICNTVLVNVTRIVWFAATVKNV